MRRETVIATLWLHSLHSYLNHLSSTSLMSLRFRLLKSCYSLLVLFKCTINFDSLCKLFGSLNLRDGLPTHISFHYSISCFLYHFNFSLDTQILPYFFVTVDMLSHYQFLANCRSRNVHGNFILKVNYLAIVIFQALNLCGYLKA